MVPPTPKSEMTTRATLEGSQMFFIEQIIFFIVPFPYRQECIDSYSVKIINNGFASFNQRPNIEAIRS